MAASRVEKNVAYSIFKLVKQGGHVPGNILAAAGRIVRNKGDAHDMQLIRDFKGIARGGATAAAREFQQYNKMASQVGQVSALVATMSQGGATGVGAGIGLAGKMATMADSFSRSPQFRQLLEKVMGGPQVSQALQGVLVKVLADPRAATSRKRHLGRLGVLSLAEQQEYDALVEAGSAISKSKLRADRAAYAIGRGARWAGVMAQRATLYGTAAFAAAGAVEAGMGLETSTGVIEAHNAARLAATFQGRGADARIAASLANARYVRMRQQQTFAWLPIIGGVWGDFNSRKAARLENKLNAERVARELNIHGETAADVFSDVRTQVLRNKYGAVGGAIAERVDAISKWAGLNTGALDREVVAEAERKGAAAKALVKQGYGAAATGMVGDARAYFEASVATGAALPVATYAMWNSANIYRDALGAQEADHWWARSQMRKAGPRTGD